MPSSPATFASALLDPPFEFMDGDNAQGFDAELMQAIAAELA
jgi:polar amino acid transport system substrate-binding protein